MPSSIPAESICTKGSPYQEHSELSRTGELRRKCRQTAVTHGPRPCLKEVRTQPCACCGGSLPSDHMHSRPLIALGLLLGPTCDDCFDHITEPFADGLLRVIGTITRRPNRAKVRGAERPMSELEGER
jgi:hypothetical protein